MVMRGGVTNETMKANSGAPKGPVLHQAGSPGLYDFGNDVATQEPGEDGQYPQQDHEPQRDVPQSMRSDKVVGGLCTPLCL